MTLTSEHVYTYKLDNLINKYNNAYHSTMKMKPFDVTSNTHIDFDIENNDNHVRISQYKNTFSKGYVQNWSKEVFLITTVKNTVQWTYVVSYLNSEEIAGIFYETKIEKTNQT